MELPSEKVASQGYPTREERKQQLNNEIQKMIQQYHPEIMAFQESIEFSLSGCWNDRASLLDTPDGYRYYSSILVNSINHPHLNKWNNVRAKGQWPTSTLFGQGNAYLVRKDVSIFPPCSLPKAGVKFTKWLKSFLSSADKTLYSSSCVQNVALESGLYFGDRDTEARGCLVLHIVIPFHGPRQEEKPLDIFVLNTHLTTLLVERSELTEGKDKSYYVQAAELRKSQLHRILNGIVLRYETWIKNGFLVRGKSIELGPYETTKRWAPLWIALGDFNFLANSEEYQWLVNQAFLPLSPANEYKTRAEIIGAVPTTTVDFVFVRPSWQYIEMGSKYNVSGSTSSIKSVSISDHCPVLAKIDIGT